MHRFYCRPEDIGSKKIIIKDREELRHLSRVLRFKTGDKAVFFDGQGNDYYAQVLKTGPENMEFKIIRKHKQATNEGIQITIACAIPKQAKMDEIIDKLTQLGVDRIIPLETERVIIRLDNTKKIARHKRWQKIACQASKQSQRSTLPVIEPIQKIEEFMPRARDYDLKLIPHLSGERRPLREALIKAEAEVKVKTSLVLIGPEGDFTEKEVKLAKEYGCIPITLGRQVLRVDTACIAVVAFLRIYENY